MTNQANFAFFLDQLYENAVLSFRETEEGRLWQEKRKQMELACDCMLTEEQMDFVTDCLNCSYRQTRRRPAIFTARAFATALQF